MKSYRLNSATLEVKEQSFPFHVRVMFFCIWIYRGFHCCVNIIQKHEAFAVEVHAIMSPSSVEKTDKHIATYRVRGFPKTLAKKMSGYVGLAQDMALHKFQDKSIDQRTRQMNQFKNPKEEFNYELGIGCIRGNLEDEFNCELVDNPMLTDYLE